MSFKYIYAPSTNCIYISNLITQKVLISKLNTFSIYLTRKLCRLSFRCNLGPVCFTVKVRKLQVPIVTYDLRCLFETLSRKS